METFSPKERSLNFSKEEKARFKNLIDKYQAVLFNKKTDNCNNVQKKKAWNAIHAEFNALSENPRTLKQLQAKFDNMKRNARKDASKQRQERFKTGGGPPPPPADADTDWLRSVMPVSMDGLASTVDDDSQIGVQKTEDIPEVSVLNKTGENMQKVEIEIASKNNITDQKEISIQDMSNMPIVIETDDYLQEIEATKENCDVGNIQKDVFNTKSPACLLRTPVSKNLKVPKQRRLSHPSGSMECQVTVERLELFKNCRRYEKEIFDLRMNVLNEKKKQDETIFKLQERKLLLEISLLERNLEK
ncbi:myb/SANT-like DNA-binding domain-containing protein 3 isoform X2 [Maniola hyperantus]|uniref:myb/SANT-like DNA-binding domain-containing protein 3 isoform X2 n=1 Tax=Aphantopus hyperantus TaxID=2795564 RepID=UPI00374A22A4